MVNKSAQENVPARGFLSGMKEITDHVGYSDATVLKHKRAYPGMPINQAGGIWVGDPEALSQFYRDLAAGKTKRYLEPQAAPALPVTAAAPQPEPQAAPAGDVK